MKQREPYTPSTEEVRRDYQWGVTSCGCCGGELKEDAEQFDRWLQTMLSKAWDQGAADVLCAKEFFTTARNPYPKWKINEQ